MEKNSAQKVLAAKGSTAALAAYSAGALLAYLLNLGFAKSKIIALAEGAVFHRKLNFEHWNMVLSNLFSTLLVFCLLGVFFALFALYAAKRGGAKRAKIATSCFLFVASLLLQLGLLYNGHYWLDDSAEYIAQAISIAEGSYKADYYANGSYIGYPVGYPLLLAVSYKLFGMNFLAFKLVNVLAYTIATVLLFNFIDYLIGDIAAAFLVSCFFCMNQLILMWQNYVMSEIPCAFFTFLALLVMYAVLYADGLDKKQKVAERVLLGICCYMAYACRTSGIVCILTLLCMHVLLLAKKLAKRGFLPRTLKSCGEIALVDVAPYLVFFGLLVFFKLLYPAKLRSDLDYLSGIGISSMLNSARLGTAFSASSICFQSARSPCLRAWRSSA